MIHAHRMFTVFGFDLLGFDISMFRQKTPLVLEELLAERSPRNSTYRMFHHQMLYSTCLAVCCDQSLCHTRRRVPETK